MEAWSSKKYNKLFLYPILTLLVIASVVVAVFLKQIYFVSLSVPTDGYTFEVLPGDNLKKITKRLYEAKILKHRFYVRTYAKLIGVSNNIKAGEYKISYNTSVAKLIAKLSKGDVIQYSLTIVEGWTFKDLLAELDRHPKIKHSDKITLSSLNIPEQNLEGLFFPDTYNFVANTTDVDFLKRAYNSMQENLNKAWQSRSDNSILKSPYEALILASIIEKESAVADEYEKISGVYQRRIKMRMRLQADPTVAYFLGDSLTGPLRHKHLKIDSPYNTYTRYGLPPSPIAMPGLKSILAAVNPDTSDNLYFVAKSDGSHIFAKEFSEHTANIKKVRGQ